MHYRIAKNHLFIDELVSQMQYLCFLKPFEIFDKNISMNGMHVNLLHFLFAKEMIPEHKNSFSGFLTRFCKYSKEEAFIFCFREGKLLFGMQRDTDGVYNAYIHSQPFISYKTAIQYTLLLEGCYKQILGMHAVTLLQGGRVVLFSAPSGTGKTTHTELWRKEFNAKILNGDYAFLECRDDEIFFHGTPFCGSSIYAEKGVWRVNDIVFLKQAPLNYAYRIGKIAAATNAMENCFIPTWDEERTKLCMDLIGKLLKNTRVWQLECNMEPEAAHVMKDAIFAGHPPK